MRLATGADVATLAALRRAWTEEDGRGGGDPDFEERFSAWFATEQQRRRTWLAERDDVPVGMLNLVLFDRMPRPGQRATGWAYVSNVFVLASHRDVGIGRLLLDAAVSYAQERGLDRVVLHPSTRSVPFYRRAGFDVADSLMLRSFEPPDEDR
ncbi:MAG: GNAT family N-acetyltransferase [Streptosporangiales bacterium]|nr:GNAT family N-acetyltransferase [Streptosporangiales bacterium]